MSATTVTELYLASNGKRTFCIRYSVQKVKAIINLRNIYENGLAFKALTGNKLCAVVKANAYGHGAEEVVNALEPITDCFAVALIEEGISIRTVACGKDILIFTPPIDEKEGKSIVQNGFIATVADVFTAKLMINACKVLKKRAKVHLKINTGMNRYGMNLSMLGKVCKLFKKQRFVQVDGIYTHLYDYDRKTAETQRGLFIKAVNLCKRYYPNATAHIGGTYGALLGEHFAFDMTRVGIGLYGYFPKKNEGADIKLKKAMQVYATTVCSRKYAYGGVGYGKPLDKKAGKTTTLSICRFGYADGFLRKQENGVENAEENANNLCMDVCVRKNSRKRGEIIPLLLDADETARKTGTISYEVLCAATRRAEFIYENE